MTSLGTFGLFNESYPPIMDGVAVAVRNYAYWLHMKGYESCVVTPRVPGYKDTEPYPVYRYPSLPVYARKPYRLGLPELDMLIHSSIHHTQFALVHAHSPFSAGLMAARIARNQHVPFIATFHSKYRDDFQRATNSSKLANLMLKEVIWFYEKADEVWVPQEAVKETLREYGYKGGIEVVDNGNDLATREPLAPIKAEARRRLNIAEEELSLLFVGQHIWEKNTRLIIEALALAAEDVPFHMYFVGVGYAAEEMKTLVRERGLENKVTFVGSVSDREEMRTRYAAADLFLFPSVYDNAPLVVREAGAMGTPAIMVQDSTAAEIISDNANGFLIDNTPEALADKLRQLARQRELVKTVGEEAARTIARSWESIVQEEVIDRYMNILRRWK